MTGPVCPAPTLSLFATEKPVFNRLAHDGGRCEVCQVREQRWYLACYDRNGNHLPNRFACDGCLPEAEREAKQAGRFDKFEVAKGEI